MVNHPPLSASDEIWTVCGPTDVFLWHSMGETTYEPHLCMCVSHHPVLHHELILSPKFVE